MLITQGWNGVDEPWVRAGEDNPSQSMPVTMREDFTADAEFDDPLVMADERGFALEYAGEDEVNGRPVVKLLATRNLKEQTTLYLAADTYFIVRQDRISMKLDGTKQSTQIFYGEFRPVQGVILPHRIDVWENDELVNQILINWMEPNPPAETGLYEATKS
ncbi:MAG: hypothetical protein J6386_22085 [Candidatus Synoicihabitans palmerolidicus]|nr:hypothetical protein [Candidatus Synoicihabitans palmerolidicus]